MNAPGLFDEAEETERAERRETLLLSSWDVWGWRGPATGELCEIDIPIADTEKGGSLFCYCERARLIALRPDGRWLAEIEMPGDWGKNGRRVILDRYNIGPPRQDIIRSRQLAANLEVSGRGTRSA